jgi:hypothetical protein
MQVQADPPASVAKSTRQAGSSWKSMMFRVRRFCPLFAGEERV